LVQFSQQDLVREEGMLAWLQNKIRQQSLWSLHKSKNYKDLLLFEILQRTYVCEAARNIGPDTPEKKNSVIEEAKHVGAIFAARPCAGRGNVGVVAKQNPSIKCMEPAQIKNYKDLLLSKNFEGGLLPARRLQIVVWIAKKRCEESRFFTPLS